MASILSQNPLPNNTADDPNTMMNNIKDEILKSPNPQQTFQQMVNKIPNGQTYLDMINQNFGGDPRQAFMSMAAQRGQENLFQSVSNWINSILG